MTDIDRPLEVSARSVTIARYLLAAVAASHALIPILMWHWHDRLSAEIAVLHPELTSSQVAISTAAALHAALVFHTILLVLCLVIIVALRAPVRWAFRLAIVSQALSVIFSIVSWRSSSMFHFLIPIVDLIEVSVIVALMTNWARMKIDTE